MTLHRCTTDHCPYLGQACTRGCRCHKTDEQVLVDQRDALLSIARRWSAMDGGTWLVERHAREEAELLADTRAIIAKVEAA